MEACENVMGTPNIILHHTKAHVKPPGKGSPFPLHQVRHKTKRFLLNMLQEKITNHYNSNFKKLIHLNKLILTIFS